MARYFIGDFHQAAVAQNNNWLTFAGPSADRWQDAMIGHNYASGQWVNELRFTFQRKNYLNAAAPAPTLTALGANVTPSPFGGFQTLQVAGGFNMAPGATNQFPAQSYNFSERWHLLRGRHQLSVGTEIQRLRVKEFATSNQGAPSVWQAQAASSPFTSGNIFADFLLGKPSYVQQGDGAFVRAVGTLYGFYGQDQIRANSRLNVTLGLRWDPYWPFHSLHGRMGCFRPGKQSSVFTTAPLGLLYPADPGCNAAGGVNADWTTFQPQIAFAYKLDEKGNSSVRGGYGMFAMQLPMQSFLPYGFQPPYIRTVRVTNPPSVSNPYLGYPGGNPFVGGFLANDASLPSNTPVPTGSVLADFDPGFKLGDVQQWNLTLEHLFAGKIMARASYVGTKGTHLGEDVESNPALYIPGTCGSTACSTTGNEQARRGFNNFGAITTTKSIGNSSYNALQLALERRLSGGLTVTSNYTWGKSLDTISQNPNGRSSFVGSYDEVTNPFNPSAYRGLSDFDLSYSFTTSLVWQAPTPKSDNLFLKHVVSHWQISGVWLWQAGIPFTVLSGLDNSLTGVGLDHVDRVPGVSPFLSPDRPRGQVAQEYFNLAAFQQNAVDTFGNSGRNILRGPGFCNLDMGLLKTIPLAPERFALTFRAEFFNISNTPHFTAPTASLSSPSAGRIISARDPRIIQFALKFHW